MLLGLNLTSTDLWALIGIAVGGVTVPVGLFLVSSSRDDERIAVAKNIEDDKRHNENVKKFELLIAERKAYKHHRHRELKDDGSARGPLLAENVEITRFDFEE